MAAAPTIAPGTPGQCCGDAPSWKQGPTSCSLPKHLAWLHGGRVAGKNPMFLSPHSRHSGNQGDPPGEELTGLRALPRGCSQARLLHVLHHPLWDGLQAADAQRGWCVGSLSTLRSHPWTLTHSPASHLAHPHPHHPRLLPPAFCEEDINLWITGLNWLVADTQKAQTPLQIER